MTAKKLTARQQFVAEVDGATIVVHAGDLFGATHPAAKAHRELFEPEIPVETATAAPGEKRKG